MTAKNSSTLHRWSEFTKWPSDEVCHQAGPPIASTHAGGEDDHERGQRQHAEDVDPRGDVRRLPVGERLPAGTTCVILSARTRSSCPGRRALGVARS